MSKLRVWTETESVEVDVNEDGVLIPELISALRFKAVNICAKADPEIFSNAADILEAYNGYPERVEKIMCEKYGLELKHALFTPKRKYDRLA